LEAFPRSVVDEKHDWSGLFKHYALFFLALMLKMRGPGLPLLTKGMYNRSRYEKKLKAIDTK
jgi:hypothetical protein